MNKLLAMLAITLTTSAYAKDNCISLAEISENIMSNRQHGTDRMIISYHNKIGYQVIEYWMGSNKNGNV